MSIKCMTAVWDRSTAKGSELLVLLALADYADDEGRNAFPAVQTLAEKTRLSERSVQRILRTLEEAGEIVQAGAGPRGTNSYRLTMRAATPPPAPAPKEEEGAEGGAKMSPRQDAGGDAHVTGGVPPVSPEPSLNHQGSQGSSIPSSRARDRAGSKKQRAEKPKRQARSPMERPTRADLRAYAIEAGLPDFAEAFADHFDSNGWRVGGRSPMQDWRAAYRNWCRNQPLFAGHRNGSGPVSANAPKLGEWS